jgi:hypothetical protein
MTTVQFITHPSGNSQATITALDQKLSLAAVIEFLNYWQRLTKKRMKRIPHCHPIQIAGFL